MTTPTPDPLTAASNYNLELIEHGIAPEYAEIATHGFVRGYAHRETEETE